MHPQQISESFVRYYQNLGFRQLSGTSLLHPSIPMTFVMSAGLAQVETAIDQLGGQSTDKNYVLVQNCFRHFDVDRIGQSNLHLSLFEMPGAFSFGHISRQITVQRMWAFLTGELKLDPQRLWATYFAGGTVSGYFFEEDLASHEAWCAVGLPESRVIGLGIEHNFWKQGGGIDDQGTRRKCGPNTELFFDRDPHLSCGATCRPGCRCGRFVEFANSLFIFAEIDVETNTLSLLEEPFTETVIGTERVAMLLVGKSTIFEIDAIRPLIEKLRTFYLRRKEYLPFDTIENEHILIDHLRALVYLTADGAPPPGKGGRRRLMRIQIRRVLAQLRILQIDDLHCLHPLIDLMISMNGHEQPNLRLGRNMLLSYVEAEAAAFDDTLSRGYRQLDRLLARGNGHALGGRELVSLVKQFGMPISLLKAILARKGLEFRESEYVQAVQQWRHNSLSLDATSR